MSDSSSIVGARISSKLSLVLATSIYSVDDFVVNESFGPTIRDWYIEPSPGKQKRLAFLCELLGLEFPPSNRLHYQLFHRTASAVLEAIRFKTDEAAMIVHSFSAADKWFDAYAAFISLFGLVARPGEMVSTHLHSGRPLRFGWAKGDPKLLRA